MAFAIIQQQHICNGPVAAIHRDNIEIPIAIEIREADPGAEIILAAKPVELFKMSQAFSVCQRDLQPVSMGRQ